MPTPEQRAWNNYMPSGQRGWQKPKLTDTQRADIVRRLTAGEKTVDLAVEYGVSGSTIRRLRQYMRPA
ncbi:Hin recombinase [Streptomyces europaeiscabiei]|uniref:Hin recombinase n=1 Tax=Streptomyces europaeiscabiei TaxID=146819 RepID=UPI0029BAFA72|nr:Hin recombinase [Streptomyces europaeiscabiei]MDX3637774.1 Hin recombinase [Streptomyces europaeiscabiei]MDX3655586.1 Hin recombinase [Streptomyces europaeiscabiei]